MVTDVSVSIRNRLNSLIIEFGESYEPVLPDSIDEKAMAAVVDAVEAARDAAHSDIKGVFRTAIEEALVAVGEAALSQRAPDAGPQTGELETTPEDADGAPSRPGDAALAALTEAGIDLGGGLPTAEGVSMPGTGSAEPYDGVGVSEGLREPSDEARSDLAQAAQAIPAPPVQPVPTQVAHPAPVEYAHQLKLVRDIVSAYRDDPHREIRNMACTVLALVSSILDPNALPGSAGDSSDEYLREALTTVTSKIRTMRRKLGKYTSATSLRDYISAELDAVLEAAMAPLLAGGTEIPEDGEEDLEPPAEPPAENEGKEVGEDGSDEQSEDS